MSLLRFECLDLKSFHTPSQSCARISLWMLRVRCRPTFSCAAQILLQSYVILLQSNQIITPVLRQERQGFEDKLRQSLVIPNTSRVITPIRLLITLVMLQFHQRNVAEMRTASLAAMLLQLKYNIIKPQVRGNNKLLQSDETRTDKAWRNLSGVRGRMET